MPYLFPYRWPVPNSAKTKTGKICSQLKIPHSGENCVSYLQQTIVLSLLFAVSTELLLNTDNEVKIANCRYETAVSVMRQEWAEDGDSLMGMETKYFTVSKPVLGSETAVLWQDRSRSWSYNFGLGLSLGLILLVLFPTLLCMTIRWVTR